MSQLYNYSLRRVRNDGFGNNYIPALVELGKVHTAAEFTGNFVKLSIP